MLVSDFTYVLPEERIATHPPQVRGASRLLVLDRSSGAIKHSRYKQLSDYLQRGDVLVINDTQVIKARLHARLHGKDRELLLLERHGALDPNRQKALYRGTLRAGDILKIHEHTIRVEHIHEGGIATISSTSNLMQIAQQYGTVPLPPYMHREATKDDINRYQTVFADHAGSVAAPTASLNFTHQLAQELEQKGVIICRLTLHVGLGTFLPIRSETLEKHDIHSEYFSIPVETAAAIQSAHKDGRKIVALGTTVTRTLEYAAQQLLTEQPQHIEGEADIFIYPGYQFKIVDGLLTNFHAPQSTVLMMAAAFAGWDHLKHAYEIAIDESYAFLSYGDSMLIL